MALIGLERRIVVTRSGHDSGVPEETQVQDMFSIKTKCAHTIHTQDMLLIFVCIQYP